MIRVESSRRYPVQQKAAFDWITDPLNWPRYWPDLVAVADLGTARWQRPGDTMRLRMKLNGRSVDLRMTLREYLPPTLVTYRSVQRGMPDMAHERHWVTGTAERGFLYRVAVEYEPRRGLAGLLDRTLIRSGVARALRRTLDNLEEPLRAL